MVWWCANHQSRNGFDAANQIVVAHQINMDLRASNWLPLIKNECRWKKWKLYVSYNAECYTWIMCSCMRWRKTQNKHKYESSCCSREFMICHSSIAFGHCTVEKKVNDNWVNDRKSFYSLSHANKKKTNYTVVTSKSVRCKICFGQNL